MAHQYDRAFHKASVFVLLIALCAPLRAQSSSDLSEQVAELRALVNQLRARGAELETRLKAVAVETPAPEGSAQPPTAAPPPRPVPEPGSLAGTTINFLVDGYYGYNFKAPIGCAKRLRAYDVTSNNFSISQVGLVLENAPDPGQGK